jgi:5-methylcytosine-specific restriction endonuclease McrA
MPRTKEEIRQANTDRKRLWRQNNREKALSTERKWREANPDKIKKYNKTNYESHPETFKRQRENHYKKYGSDETHREQSRRWRSNNPDKVKMQRYKRWAAEHNPLVSTLTKEQWDSQLKFFNNKCAYCGNEMTKVTLDHIIPLSKGGEHSVVNVVPCCPTCNFRKGTKSIEEFLCHIHKEESYAEKHAHRY